MDEFWKGDPELFWAYRFSYISKLKMEHDLLNYKAWLSGAYNYEAVLGALSSAFSKKPIPYRNQPFGYEEKKIDTISLVESQLRSRMKKVQQVFGVDK